MPHEYATICTLTESETKALCDEIVSLSIYRDLKLTNESIAECSQRLAIFPFSAEFGHVKMNISARRCPITTPIRLWVSQGNANDNGTVYVYQQFSAQGPIQFDTCLAGFERVNVFQSIN